MADQTREREKRVSKKLIKLQEQNEKTKRANKSVEKR
jgi:hypothetical protein